MPIPSEFQVDFIGIGVMKAASSWIFECLKEHPEICMCAEKEPHFFDWPFRYKRGLEYYYSLYKQCPQDKIIGEFTASYIRFPEALSLISKHFPKVKLIVSLRNPVERAISQYKYNLEMGGRLSIYKDFREALDNDEDNIVERGFYFKQLKSCFDIFPKEQVLIMFFDDIKINPFLFLQKIYKFLELKDLSFMPTLLNKKVLQTGSKSARSRVPFISKIIFSMGHMVSKIPKLKSMIFTSQIMEYIRRFINFNRKFIFQEKENEALRAKINDGTRLYLYEVYKEDIEKLEKLLERDLSSWKIIK